MDLIQTLCVIMDRLQRLVFRHVLKYYTSKLANSKLTPHADKYTRGSTGFKIPPAPSPICLHHPIYITVPVFPNPLYHPHVMQQIERGAG